MDEMNLNRETTAEPVTEPVTEPVAEPAAEPAAETMEEPAAPQAQPENTVPVAQPVPPYMPPVPPQPMPYGYPVPPAQPVQAPQSPQPPYGVYPPQPVVYYAMPPQPQPAPQPQPKTKMRPAQRILVVVLIVLFTACVAGLVAFAVSNAMQSSPNNNSIQQEIEGLFPTPAPENPEDLPPVEDEGEDSEESEFQLPNIEVVPNTQGIQLHSVPRTAEMEITEVYDRVMQSTVLVIVETENGSGGTGTGIIATEDGYIITNSHVVMNSRNVAVQIKTNDGATRDAVVVGYDKTTDLAVLKMDGNGYVPAEFGNSDELRMGEWVLAIGNPGGERFSGSITRGIVSGLGRSVGVYSESGMTYIQTDAAINPGNSGGPLVNLHGQVVGISSAKIVSDKYEGMGFAIPINGAKSIVDDLLAGGYVQGRVRFGIKGTPVTEYQSMIYEVPMGFLIHEIDEDSCFVGTEVQVYDIITAVDDASTASSDLLSNALLRYKPGDTAEITLFRPSEDGVGGETFKVTVTFLEDKGETQK